MTTYTKVKFHLARLSNWLYVLATLFFLFSIVLLLFMLRDLIHHSFCHIARDCKPDAHVTS